jgi:hypothetical protein
MRDAPGGNEIAVYGQRIEGVAVNGRNLHAGVFNESEVRAAAGMTMVIGAVAFVLARTQKIYIPLQLTTIFFFIVSAAYGLIDSRPGRVRARNAPWPLHPALRRARRPRARRRLGR